MNTFVILTINMKSWNGCTCQVFFMFCQTKASPKDFRLAFLTNNPTENQPTQISVYQFTYLIGEKIVKQYFKHNVLLFIQES